MLIIRLGNSKKMLLRKIQHQFARWNRRRKMRFVLGLIRKYDLKSCLIVGATPSADITDIENLIERGIRDAILETIVSGLEASSDVWTNWCQADGRDLPFIANSFDFVFSNAVIEHVGNKEDQIRFIEEHNRVGNAWLLTTPNRLFPIESHTQILFSHMRKGWQHPSISRLLSKRDLKEILPPGAVIRGHTFSPTFICYKVPIRE